MNWREYIAGISADAEFNPPASASEVAAAETVLKVKLPKELKELLRQCNGVSGPYGIAFIWSTAEIAKRNIEMRSYPGFEKLYMPFDPLLFFGDAGNGDLFFLLSLPEKFANPSCSAGITKPMAEYNWTFTSKPSSIGG